MPSMKDDFNELLERIRRGRELSHASFEPVYYLVFAPKLILEVKRQLPAWEARLRNEGWEVHTFSIAEAVLDIVRSAPLRKLWLRADSKRPLAWERRMHPLPIGWGRRRKSKHGWRPNWKNSKMSRMASCS